MPWNSKKSVGFSSSESFEYLFTAAIDFSQTSSILATGMPVVGVALVFYGAGNGIYSIARGTVPLALFGTARYPVLVGRLARPGLVAQALAPSLGAMALAHGGADAAYGLLLALALVNLGLACALWGTRPGAAERSGAFR